jgi:hypothetical protein
VEGGLKFALREDGLKSALRDAERELKTHGYRHGVATRRGRRRSNGVGSIGEGVAPFQGAKGIVVR